MSGPILLGGAVKAGSSELLGAVADEIRRAHPKPKIGVLNSSKEDLDTARDVFASSGPLKADHWRSLGIEPVFLPAAIDSTEAELREAARRASEVDAFFLAGGDQAKHARVLVDASGRDTPLMSVIRARQAAGAPVIGTSAGSAVMPARMFGEGTSTGYLDAHRLPPQRDRSTLADPRHADNGTIGHGLDLLPVSAVVDTHVDRGRLGRMLVALRDSGERWAIGVAEDTGMFFEDNRRTGRVRGSGGVLILDARHARFSRASDPFSATDVRLHYLNAGDRFDFDNGRVLSERPEAAPRLDRRQYYDSPDIFRPYGYELEKVLAGLADSEARWAYGDVPGLPLELRFDKDTNTVSRRAGARYTLSDVRVSVLGRDR